MWIFTCNLLNCRTVSQFKYNSALLRRRHSVLSYIFIFHKLIVAFFQAYYSRGERQPTPEEEKVVAKILDKKRKELGTISMHEIQVGILQGVSFIMLALFIANCIIVD